jgi:ADP-heptose:LPS heptosyltransferase
MLTTPSFRALKEQYPKCKVMVYCQQKSHLDVYKNNPNIDGLKLARFYSAPIQYIEYKLRLRKFYRNNYGIFRPSFHPMGKAADIIATMLDTRLNDRRMQIFLTEDEEEEAKARLSRCPIAVAMHVTPGWTSNKSWPAPRWVELVESNSKITFVQLGLLTETLIPGAVDLRGIPLREAFAVIKHSRGFVGVESVFAHIAAAFGTPGVVLFGPSGPAVWGHDGNINLYAGLRCSPCADILKRDACPYGKPCMTHISVSDVSEALTKQLLLDDNLSLYSAGASLK